jgi:sugar/nucleoside kinase (ribokinase family)
MRWRRRRGLRACRLHPFRRPGEADPGAERAEVPVEKITPVDATGAGDQFAAGFLYGMATGQDLETAGRMGVAAAAEVIRHIGPRPKRPLRELFADQGLI